MSVLPRIASLVLSIVAFVACTSEPPLTPASCQEDLRDRLTEDGRIGSPVHPLMPQPLIYPDTTVAHAKGLVVDAKPLSRGHHGVERYWQHPISCDIAGGSYPWAPPVATGPPAHTKTIGVDGLGTWRIRGLLITGENSGADSDSIHWNTAFTALGARATHQHGPSLIQVEEIIRGELCAGVNELESVVLVLAGRGTPVGGGSFLLGKEAITYSRLGEWMNESCSNASSLIVVIDSSYAGQFIQTFQATIPTRIFSASSIQNPLAPRVGPKDGGLLTKALTQSVLEQADMRCLGAVPSVTKPGQLKSIHPSTTILWKVFDAWDIGQAMRLLRWQSVGQPAIASSEGGITMHDFERFQKALFQDIPTDIETKFGELTEPQQCTNDETCALIHEGCDTGQCRAWRCRDGQCELEQTLFASCDDENNCTEEDVCRGGTVCQGEVIDCDDGEPCTSDTCLYGIGCTHEPIAPGEPCDDGDPCTENDLCDMSDKCVGEPVTCDDDDPCTGTECDIEVGCTYEFVLGPCDDGSGCTHQDYCKDGDCLGVPIPCNDQNPCTIDSCDETTEDCMATPAPNGKACSDGNLCTTNDGCLEGECTGTTKDCDDGVACTYDSCDNGACVHLPPPSTCTDGDSCVPVGETSNNQPCLVCKATNVWTPVDGVPCSDDGIECTLDVCESGVCVHPNTPNTCVSQQGECVDVGQNVGDCLTCVATGTVQVSALGATCDDGDACTMNDVCSAEGLCVGAVKACCPAVSELACGETILGDTEFSGNLQQSWSCMPGFNFTGHEGVHRFVAECDGPVSVNLDAKPGVGVLLVEGDIETCSQGECSAFSQKAATVMLSEGDEVTVVVDSFGANGLYNLTVQCSCGN